MHDARHIPPTYDTASTAARRLGVAAITVSRWAAAGRLRYLTAADGTRLYDPRDVDRLAHARAEAAATGAA
jgi:predicted site-specific integrase-resolvase